MKRRLLVMALLMLALLLFACGAGTGNERTGGSLSESAQSNAAGNNDAMANGAADSQETGKQSGAGAPGGLTDQFDGALSVVGQLALGTVELEDSDLAIDETQAIKLLPLWDAYQSLSQSDTTADIELEAVIKQLSGSMTAEQIAAISAMQLTENRLSELQESGELGFGGFGRGGGSGSGDGQGSGLRGGGAGGFPGGGPGGDLPGGGPPGMGPGGFGGDLSAEDIATRQAEMEQGGLGANAERLLTGMVIRLLEDKTGVVSEREIRGQVMNDAFASVAAASGLTVEELMGQLAEGQSLASVVEQNGGDVEALTDRLQDIFSELPDAQELDLEQSINEWLGLE